MVEHVGAIGDLERQWTCCSTNSTPAPISSAIRRRIGSSRSTMIGASPRLISSTSSSCGRADQRAADGQHLLLAARQQAGLAVQALLERGEASESSSSWRQRPVADVPGAGSRGRSARRTARGPRGRARGPRGRACRRARAGDRLAERARSSPEIGAAARRWSSSVVVLPAPLGPSSATTSPASTCRSRSRTAGIADVAGVQVVDVEQRVAHRCWSEPRGRDRRRWASSCGSWRHGRSCRGRPRSPPGRRGSRAGRAVGDEVAEVEHV